MTVSPRAMTLSKFALTTTAAAVTFIGMAATAHADPPVEIFQSPSGNVRCEITVNHKGVPYADCTVRDAAYATAADQCEIPGPVNPQFSIAQGDTADMSCVVNVAEPAWPTLDFGQTRSVATITCGSEPAGVTCTDTGTGRFFRISPEFYDLG